MAKLIGREWNKCLNKCTHEWLSDDGTELTADFDPDSAEGSTITVIATSTFYVKNTEGKWQKLGSDEVIA